MPCNWLKLLILFIINKEKTLLKLLPSCTAARVVLVTMSQCNGGYFLESGLPLDNHSCWEKKKKRSDLPLDGTWTTDSFSSSLCSCLLWFGLLDLVLHRSASSMFSNRDPDTSDNFCGKPYITIICGLEQLIRWLSGLQICGVSCQQWFCQLEACYLCWNLSILHLKLSVEDRHQYPLQVMVSEESL